MSKFCLLALYENSDKVESQYLKVNVHIHKYTVIKVLEDSTLFDWWWEMVENFVTYVELMLWSTKGVKLKLSTVYFSY